LRAAGLPDAVCSHPAMNLFFLHPLIDRWKPGGSLVGDTALLVLFATHYAVLLLALRRARPQQPQPR